MKAKLSALTSLRFFAALLVFFSHLSFLQQSESPTAVELFNKMMYEGYIGVTFFFILSGFILSYANHGRTSSYKNYLYSRLARIYPLHLLTLLCAIPLLLAVRGVESVSHWGKYIASLAYNATLTQALSSSSSKYFSFNAPSWSLSVELFFYVLFPFFAVLRTKTIMILALCVITLKGVLVLVVKPSAVHYIFYICPPLRLGDFLVGILLFRMYLGGTAPSVRGAGMLQCTSLLLLLAFASLGQYVPQAYRFDIYYILPMGLLVYSFAFQYGVLARALSNKVLVLLGEASFAFYLVHQLIIIAGQHVRLRAGSDHMLSTDIFYGFVYFVSALILSLLLFKFFETPARMKMLDYLRTARIRSFSS
ncbi:acyltransferase family protein [Pseudomonas sp. CAM1A]|uniref:acyltransferase family protein n=1 Tax=Pseudomonas sp. CAM1A TaxID=3231717 RepID=UPI0039C666D7